MLGLPVGVALSFAVSGTIAKEYGWRAAFFVAGVPGIICAIAVLFVREPKRGAAELHDIGSQTREGSAYWNIIKSPTMIWIILSGAIHNFNMYAIGSFITPFLMRYHELDIQQANFVSMLVFGLMGAPGLLIGGFIGDWAMKKRRNGRMVVGTIAIALSVPAVYFALSVPKGATTMFLVLMGIACALMYFYYSTVYSTIQDVTEPASRGTAMAVYFFAMYVLGASLGPYGTGLLSDFYTKRAAQLAGVTDIANTALEPFRAEGLHTAMYAIPILGVLLTIVLFAGSRTVTKEIDTLQKWMRDSSKERI
jgi:predicted MFS family arabinose efflux permease